MNFLIFGGTGSLGRTLLRRLGHKRIIVFSRDEAKQHALRQQYPDVEYVIGDIRNYDSVYRVIERLKPRVIINAAAMKQVPACECHPYEAIQTNTIGTYNIVKAIEDVKIENVKALSVSTDKACRPTSVYGMTKALQERIHISGRAGIYNCVRYGNVLNSTGSVIPLFIEQLQQNKDLKVTDPRMTRFLMSLDQAVDLIFTALEDEEGGKIFVPKTPTARIVDLAYCLKKRYGQKHTKIIFTKPRPGEKFNEILVSEEEISRTEELEKIYIIHNIKSSKTFNDLDCEYSSKLNLLSRVELKEFLRQHNVI